MCWGRGGEYRGGEAMASPACKKLPCSPERAAGGYLGTGGKDGLGPPGSGSILHGSSAPGPSIYAWGHRFVPSHAHTRKETRRKTHFLCSPTHSRDSLMRLFDVKPRQRDASPPRARKAD